MVTAQQLRRATSPLQAKQQRAVSQYQEQALEEEQRIIDQQYEQEVEAYEQEQEEYEASVVAAKEANKPYVGKVMVVTVGERSYNPNTREWVKQGTYYIPEDKFREWKVGMNITSSYAGVGIDAQGNIHSDIMGKQATVQREVDRVEALKQKSREERGVITTSKSGQPMITQVVGGRTVEVPITERQITQLKQEGKDIIDTREPQIAPSIAFVKTGTGYLGMDEGTYKKYQEGKTSEIAIENIFAPQLVGSDKTKIVKKARIYEISGKQVSPFTFMEEKYQKESFVAANTPPNFIGAYFGDTSKPQPTPPEGYGKAYVVGDIGLMTQRPTTRTELQSFGDIWKDVIVPPKRRDTQQIGIFMGAIDKTLNYAGEYAAKRNVALNFKYPSGGALSYGFIPRLKFKEAKVPITPVLNFVKWFALPYGVGKAAAGVEAIAVKKRPSGEELFAMATSVATGVFQLVKKPVIQPATKFVKEKIFKLKPSKIIVKGLGEKPIRYEPKGNKVFAVREASVKVGKMRRPFFNILGKPYFEPKYLVTSTERALIRNKNLDLATIKSVSSNVKIFSIRTGKQIKAIEEPFFTRGTFNKKENLARLTTYLRRGKEVDITAENWARLSRKINVNEATKTASSSWYVQSVDKKGVPKTFGYFESQAPILRNNEGYEVIDMGKGKKAISPLIKGQAPKVGRKNLQIISFKTKAGISKYPNVSPKEAKGIIFIGGQPIEYENIVKQIRPATTDITLLGGRKAKMKSQEINFIYTFSKENEPTARLLIQREFEKFGHNPNILQGALTKGKRLQYYVNRKEVLTYDLFKGGKVSKLVSHTLSTSPSFSVRVRNATTKKSIGELSFAGTVGTTSRLSGGNILQGKVIQRVPFGARTTSVKEYPIVTLKLKGDTYEFSKGYGRGAKEVSKKAINLLTGKGKGSITWRSLTDSGTLHRTTSGLKVSVGSKGFGTTKDLYKIQRTPMNKYKVEVNKVIKRNRTFPLTSGEQQQMFEYFEPSKKEASKKIIRIARRKGSKLKPMNIQEAETILEASYGETPIQQIHRLPPTAIGVAQTATMELPFATTMPKEVVFPIARALTMKEQKVLQQNKLLVNQKPIVLMKPIKSIKELVLQEETQKVIQKELQRGVLVQKQVQKQVQQQKQVQKSVQKTALKNAIAMTTAFTPTTPPTTTPPTIVPFIETLKAPKTKEQQKVLAKFKAYQLMIKEKGVFKNVGKAQPRGKAIKLGALLTKQRLASTFKVAPTKQEVSGFDINFQPSPKEFRSYKIVKGKQVPLQDTWIELRGKRLTTRGEKQAFKIARRQKGGMNWL